MHLPGDDVSVAFLKALGGRRPDLMNLTQSQKRPHIADHLSIRLGDNDVDA